MQPNNELTRTIYFEGNVASGKSTFLIRVRDFLNERLPNSPCVIFPEPLDEWRAFGPNQVNYLQRMYENPQANAFHFQVMALITKLNQVRPVPGKINLIERSIRAQSLVFIPLLFEQGKITEDEKFLLEIACESVASRFEKGDLVVFMDTPPETCEARMLERGREEEANVSLSYLRDISRHYELYLASLRPRELFRVPGSYEPEDIEPLLRVILGQVGLGWFAGEIVHNEIELVPADSDDEDDPYDYDFIANIIGHPSPNRDLLHLLESDNPDSD